MIKFYIAFKRFSLKCEELSDARVVSITENNIFERKGKVFQFNFHKDS